MKKFNGREMKALFVLSIIVPVGLLTSLRLTGILKGPITISETITLEAVKWEFQRPAQFTYIDKKLNATYEVEGLSSTFSIVIGIYDENSVAYLGADYIDMAIKMNSTIANTTGFIQNVEVILRKDSQPSLVDWLHTYFNFTNLSIVDLAPAGGNSSEAHITLQGVNYPYEVNFSATAVWSLLTLNDRTHHLDVACELIYYDGIVYRRVIQPFQLKIVGR